jgi:peptidylprolyl isomerase
VTSTAVQPTTVASTRTIPPAEELPVVGGARDTKPSIRMPALPPPTALVVSVVAPGDGPEIVAGQQITVHYVGQVWSTGREFDSTWNRGKPTTFPIAKGGLIEAWDVGLLGQRVGSRVLIVAPPNSAYGSTGKPESSIGPTDTLVFAVDVLAAA